MKKSALRPPGLMLTVMFLVLAASSAVVPAGGKSEALNAQYRKIAEQMKELYTGGKLHQVIGLYNGTCCKPGSVTGKLKPGKEKKEFKKVKKEIRADIYHFLALSLIALHRLEPGEIYIRKILVLRRDEGTGGYWLSIRETAKNRYYVAPRLLVGVKLGTNFTMAHPGDRYAVMEFAAETGGDTYRKEYGFHFTHSRGSQAGVIIEYALSKNLSVVMQPTVTSLKFQYKNSFERKEENINSGGNTVITTTTLDYTHRQELGYLEIPLLLKYRLIKSKIKPYFQVGAYYSVLQSGTKTLDAVRLPDEEYKEEAIVDIKQLFTGANFGIWVGAGIGYEIGGFHLQIEANYKHGFNNIIDEAGRFENKELMFAYYDVFDDIKLRNWDISLKVLLPISFKAFRR
jgi:hypothetical protein